MNTKLLMSICAFLLIISGIILLFLPQEIALNLELRETSVIFLQLLGTLYFAFGVTNWMAKSNIIGGIYGKPILIGNFSHFFIGALTLIKLLVKSQSEIFFVIASIIYLIFAVIFGYLLFRHPKIKKES